MRARFLWIWLLGSPSLAMPITYYEPGYGNAGPMILADEATAGRTSISLHDLHHERSREYGRKIHRVAAVEDNLPPSVSPVHQKLAANSWIDREHNKQGERCCDAGKDCHVVPANRVMSHRGGVQLPDYGDAIIPGDQILISQDGQYWICLWGGKVRCFHAPHNGS